MLSSYSIGVLFVHGIGRQRRGETLIRFGEPLAREVHERFSAAAPSETLVPERPGVIQLGAASLNDPDTPPHVEIKLRNIQSFRAKPSANPDTDWLFAEAWWADVFPTPPLQEIVRWSFDIVPWTLIAHFDTRVRRALFRLRQAATWEEQARAIVGAAWESLVLMFVSLVGIPLLFVLLVTILMVAALPISYARNVAAWLQRVIAATIGDSYVLVGWPIAAAAIVERVARDFAWLQERCQRVIIVAHSQGAAITHEFLRNAPLTPCDAFVTFGSGLRKLSEIRDAVDSKGQGWLRLLVAAGLVGDGLFITLITNFAVPGLWPWLLLGIALMVVASRVAVVMWRKANERSTSVEEQWITDRKQYDRRYRLPARFHWIDCFASADPVPNGPLLDSFEPVEIRTRCFENYHSVLGDHNAYWRNKDDFVAQLGSELMRQAGIDSKRVDPDDVERQYVATARRQFRVLWLRASRWVVLLASLVAISAWWSTAPAWFGGSVAAIARALGQIPWVGSALAQHGGTGLGHPPGILLIAIAAAAWIVLLRLIWNWWNARDIQRRYRREEYPIPIADYRWGLFVALLMAGFVLVLWATWLTGDARPAMVVTIGVAGLFALVAVTELTRVTEILRALRALSADGPLAPAVERLGEVARRRLERGVMRRRGWAAFELGAFVMEADPRQGVAAWQRALEFGFNKAAFYLGLHFEHQAPARAIEYFSKGMEKGDPDCAWFKGALQESQGDVVGALETFRIGLERLQSPRCATSLARLLIRTNRGGALDIYEKGIKLGDAWSAIDLGELLRAQAKALPSATLDEQGPLLLRSEANFRKALQLGEIDAAVPLGQMLLEKGDIVGAREVLTAGMQLRRPLAAFKLGELATQERDYELAQRAFERCIELANDEALAMEASYRLGRVFEMTERPAAAERSYRRALGSGGIGSAAAALRLAEIVQASEGGAGNAEEQIRALYLRAIQLGSAEAALRLGQLEEQNLRDAEAESAYRKGMELGSAKSALELGRFLAERRTDLRGVGEAYLRAWTVAKGELPGAWLDLIERHSDIDGARAALAHPGGFIGDAGLRRLGKILEASGDPEGAAAVYARIRRSNDALRARRPQPPPEATPPAIAPQK